MKTSFLQLFFCLLLALTAGCASAPASYGIPGGGLLGLGAEEDPFDPDWERRPPAEMLLPGGSDLLLFDAWSIEDSAYRERLFNLLFPLLQSLRTLPEEADHQGLELLLMLLSAELDQAGFELLFFTRPETKEEGLLLRIVEPEGAGIWLEAHRELDGPTAPIRWILRAEPSFDHTPGLTIRWERSAQSWSPFWVPGAGGDEAHGVPFEMNAAPFLAILEETLWEEVTGRNSLSPPFAILPQKSKGELAPGWPNTLGHYLQDRGLENLSSESVFWPRSVEDPLENFQ